MGKKKQKKILAAERQAAQAAEIKKAADYLRVQRQARRLVDAEEAADRVVVLPRQTLEQALAAERPDIPHRIAGFHAVGHNSTIAATFKTGTTVLSGNILRSLADDEPFLDRYDLIKPTGRIGMLNYELTEGDMLDWLEDQEIRKVGRIAILNLRGTPFSLAHERNQEELARWCLDMEVEVLYLDPHRRAFMGFGSENSNDDVNLFTDTLDEIKRQAAVSDLFLNVHSGRSFDAGSEHARGATALDDWADNRWVLTRNEHGDRFLYMDGRAGDGYVSEFRLEYDRASRHLTAADGNRRDSVMRRYRAEILTALEVVAEEGALVTELETKLGVTKKGALSPAIKELVREGLIFQGQKGSAKPCYLKEYAPEGGVS